MPSIYKEKNLFYHEYYNWPFVCIFSRFYLCTIIILVFHRWLQIRMPILTLCIIIMYLVYIHWRPTNAVYLNEFLCREMSGFLSYVKVKLRYDVFTVCTLQIGSTISTCYPRLRRRYSWGYNSCNCSSYNTQFIFWSSWEGKHAPSLIFGCAAVLNWFFLLKNVIEQIKQQFHYCINIYLFLFYRCCLVPFLVFLSTHTHSMH